MFNDPQSVVIDTVPVSLPRVQSQGRTGVYESADGNLTLTISHQNAKRGRSVVRIDRKKVGPDALDPSTNKVSNFAVFMVCDVPYTGFTDEEVISHIDALVSLVSTGDFASRFLGQES